ncbi:hypothetical protein [Hydrogenophaga luteola]|uniref:PH domain-containing protein n=1 Tax=Hydrogenophaga luteola TaxID=1591122 RepID=A0ABV7WA31_9BURK
MRSNETLRFDYKFTATSAVTMVIAAFAVTAGLGYIAYTNPETRLTMVISRLLSPSVPPIIFWALTALCFIAALFTLHVAFRASRSISHVELGPNGALVPLASISMKPITIPYGSIRNIQVKDIQGQQLAVISSTVGESRLLAKFFATPSDFTAFLLALERRRHA